MIKAQNHNNANWLWFQYSCAPRGNCPFRWSSCNLRRKVEESRSSRISARRLPFVQPWPAAKRQSLRQQQGARAAALPRSIPVGVATVKQRDFPVYLTGLGSVQAFNTVSLKSRVDGQIMQVNFQEGQDVRKGDLLIVIDERPFQVALATAQANLQRDEAQLKNAQGAVRAQQSALRGRRHRQAGPRHHAGVIRTV